MVPVADADVTSKKSLLHGGLPSSDGTRGDETLKETLCLDFHETGRARKISASRRGPPFNTAFEAEELPLDGPIENTLSYYTSGKNIVTFTQIVRAWS